MVSGGDGDGTHKSRKQSLDEGTGGREGRLGDFLSMASAALRLTESPSRPQQEPIVAETK